MAIADYLQKIGHGLEEGVETAGRVAGAVAEPLGKSVAETLSGEAPQIHAEKRQHAQQLSDEQRQNEINDLEKQLDEGRKYGTLTTEQQKQYTDAIARHYSDPSQMGTLIQKLHKATHPGGATYQPYAPQLADPTPTGGEARADETEKLKYQADEAKQQQEQNQENTKASWDFFSKFIPDEDKPKAQSEWAMKNLGVAQTLKNIPGATGQPVKGADGRYYLPKEQADGTIVQEPMPPDWKPQEKTPPMKPGMAGGKQAFAYYSMDQKAWIDSNSGQPIHNFIPQPSFAQTGLWGLDTGYDAQGNPTPVMLDRRSGRVVPAPAGIVAPAQAKGIEGQRTAAIAGDSLLRMMLGAADRAKQGDQQAALSVVANHIGMTLGAQKGARINQAVWNEATESAPWLQNIQKRFGPDGYLQGVTLSPQQVDQMVELGKLRRDVMWEQASQTAQAAGVPLQVPKFELHPTTTGASPVKPGNVLPKTGAKPISDDDFLLQVK
jgi:hypothetical protein